MYTVHVYAKGAGLCNQLFAFANGIASAPPRKAISVGPFSADFKNCVRVPASQLINLSEIGNTLQLALHDAPLNSSGRFAFSWYTRNQKRFVEILRAIRFAPRLEQFVDRLWATQVGNVGVINVVHFRIEPDAISHWSRQNKMTPEQFTRVLHNKYRLAISENIAPESVILALTYDFTHPLIQELATEYQILSVNSKQDWQKELGITGREVSAAIDLLLGEKCNGVFVGCHNFAKNRGSTFSWTLWQRMKNCKKGVFLDLDEIQRDLQLPWVQVLHTAKCCNISYS